MKKSRIIPLILSALLVSLPGCSDSGTGNNTDSSSSQTESVSSADAVSSKAENSESGDEINLDISLALGNSWESEGKTCYEYHGTITNNETEAVNGWSVSIPVNSDSSLSGGWGGIISLENSTVSITPEDYNSVIEAGGKIEFGIQILSSGEIDLSKAVCKASKGGGAVSQAENQNQNSSNSGGEAVKNTGAKEVPPATTDDWLSVKGSKIVDSDGKEVWLTGCNWFGYNTGTNCFDGLWACDLNSSLASIADHGFNLLRIPISTELINNWENGNYPEANYNNATNSYLEGMNSLEIFDYVIGQCRANGIKIMIDIHCAVTDSMGHMKPLWTDGDISEEDYLDGLEWMAERYKDDDTIIAYDLENEPHGKQNESPRAKWDDSKDADNWKYIAEKAANTVLDENPNVLVMVEGIEIYPRDIKKNGDFKSQNEDDYFFNWWGGNLRGVADNPVDLGKYQNKLVYSPHDYGPAVYEQPWFEGGYTFDSLYEDCWYDNWFYIQDKNIAPLLIGEWGGYMTEPNVTWMTYLRQLISENKINHTFWCFNANSGDTGGLVKDDFMTWDTEKYEFVKEVLWQKDGKFVGLDHEIPLGENGITLSDY
ncbi:cellulase family glycosylhydrolase [Porcipelethomonas sp.]|uniref:cellulase family glycosylhydrolase n=1 Tax=Porcipelethomonas sp. TaxID=2981675 RepID=UPI003EF21121